MQVESSASIIARLEASRIGRPSGIVAADADGTLWSGDVGHDLIRDLIARGPIHSVAEDRLRRFVSEYHIPCTTRDARSMVVSVLDAYVADLVPELEVCELIVWMFAGWSRSALAEFARDVVERGGVRYRLHAEASRVLQWAVAQQIDVYVVSASPRPVVEEAVLCLPFPIKAVAAVTPEYENEVVQLRLEKPVPYGKGKVEALRSLIGSSVIYAAFGDNVFDIPLLCEAVVPVAVRPKDRLEGLAHQVPGLVRLEL